MVCPSWIDLLWDWTVSAVEASKVTQISLSEPQRSLSGDTATGHGMYFPFESCTPSYSWRSFGGVHFLRMFCMNYRFFSVSMLLNHLFYFRNLDDVTNMVADVFHLVQNDNFHCQTLYKIYFEKRQIWHIWQCKIQLANLVANREWEIG